MYDRRNMRIAEPMSWRLWGPALVTCASVQPGLELGELSGCRTMEAIMQLGS